MENILLIRKEDEVEVFDLEDYSWKLLQRACETYKKTGGLGDSLSLWLQEEKI